MPIISGPHVSAPANDLTAWGLATFPSGAKNVTEPHFHDCDEYVCMISGRMTMRSEGVVYVMSAGDTLVTRMGDEHEILEIVEDATFFWFETQLRGQKRSGHLIRGVHA